MKNSILVVMMLTLVLGVAFSAEAVLIDRGGGMIYSTAMDVTWLQDANYAKTSSYDADGLMTWNDAMTWAGTLSYGGYEDWRLPTFDENNPDRYDGSLLHEMAYLYAVELENYNYMLEHTGPFTNLPPSGPGGEWIEPWYWTGTLDSLDATRAWRFDFTCG